jgi:hypothetical protein
VATTKRASKHPTQLFVPDPRCPPHSVALAALPLSEYPLETRTDALIGRSLVVARRPDSKRRAKFCLLKGERQRAARDDLHALGRLGSRPDLQGNGRRCAWSAFPCSARLRACPAGWECPGLDMLVLRARARTSRGRTRRVHFRPTRKRPGPPQAYVEREGSCRGVIRLRAHLAHRT